MTYEEYEKSINSVLSNPDTALANIPAVLDEIKKDLTSLETVTTENASLQQRIKDLQETNMKLYLSMTGSEPDTEEDEPATGLGVIDEFLADVFKESEDK